MQGLGVGCRLTKVNRGSFGPSECLFVLGWMCKVGEHMSLTWDAVSLSIEVAVCLTGT